MFLGVNIKDLYLKHNGWGIMLGWTVWLILFVVLIESFSYSLKSTTRVRDMQKREKVNFFLLNYSKIFISNLNNLYLKLEYIKYALLVLHFIVSIGFTVALMVLIGIATEESLGIKYLNNQYNFLNNK